MSDQPYRSVTLERHGFTFTVEWFYDDLPSSPLEHCELAGQVTQTHSLYGQPAKRPGDLVLHHNQGDWWFYSYDQAVANLRRQGLDGPTAAECARTEYEWLRRWYAEQWWYAYVRVTLDGAPNHFESLGGVEDTHCNDATALANVSDYVEDFISSLLSDAAKTVQQAHANGCFPAYL